MSIMQREQNPDVNTYIPDGGPGESPGTDNGADDVEREVPVPPDTERKAPVEEPPGSGGPPVGDVDDSPKLIV